MSGKYKRTSEIANMTGKQADTHQLFSLLFMQVLLFSSVDHRAHFMQAGVQKHLQDAGAYKHFCARPSARSRQEHGVCQSPKQTGARSR